MKKVLIITPYFPPTNGADMQRVRMSLPYFNDFGWDAEVVTVNQIHSDLNKDGLLKYSIPNTSKVHLVEALPKKLTKKFGLGSIALRSMPYYRSFVNTLLKENKFDLIYFSTTQFPLCILGRYWKRKFNVPYVIDMQDPWHSDYYLDKPKEQRPPKFFITYRLNKFLESVAMKSVGGLISVSEAYITQLKGRYVHLASTPSAVITFGYFEKDFEIAKKHQEHIKTILKLNPEHINLLYIGRGGYDMQPAIKILFKALKKALATNYNKFNLLRFHFFGTSYAPANTGTPTFLPVAENIGVKQYVTEDTNRVSFYETIKALQLADALIMPGSNDSRYTASKLYPYVLAKKPLLGIFHRESSAFKILKTYKAGVVVDIDDETRAIDETYTFLELLVNKQIPVSTEWSSFNTFNAKAMTEKQCDLFDKVIC